MKLPTWVPRISRPWNEDWRDTFDAMSDNEKRWSFVVDVIICAVVIGAAIWAGGQL